MKGFLLKLTDWLREIFRKYLHSENKDLPYYVTILIALGIFSLALNAFIEITDELFENQLGAFDRLITDVVLSFRSDRGTAFFEFMTHVGDRYAYAAIGLAMAAYFYLRHRSWKFILQTIFVLMMSTVSNVVLKRVFNRSRPTIEHLVSVDTLSYPSGHSMAAMAFYGFLIYLVTQLHMRPVLRWILIVFLVLVIFCVGVSRIYLGVHFPSDVAAGFMGGLIWVTFCVILFNIVTLLRRQHGS